MTKQKNLAIAGLLGALAVAIGAFGAHGLRPHLSPTQIDTFNTASNYHFYHTLAILALAVLSNNFTKNTQLKWIIYTFVIGIILFSGSLYLLACKDVLQLGGLVKIIGPITPIGGLAFIVGWIMLLLQGFVKPRSST